MNLLTYPDADMLMIDLANKLAGELESALLHQERATFAVPGGTTPGPLFDELCAADLDWGRVDVILTDERLVPPDHPRSNERLLKERLLVGRAEAAQFHRLVPEGNEIEPVVAKLTGLLPVSVLLLGMGADMHTASLFPGSPDLEAALSRNAPPVMQVAASGDLEPRITLTAPVLRGAITTHLLILGQEKRDALDTARKATPSKAPVSLVLGDAEIHWAP